MAWKTTLEQLRKAQAVSHLRRIGKPLPEEWKRKMREKARTPSRIAIAIKNLPHYKKGEHPTLGRKWSVGQREKLLHAFEGRIPWNKGEHGVQDCSHLRGEKQWNWKGGITPKRKQIRDSLEYKLWRKAVFERDNWTCQICGERGKYLQADHIKPFALFPKLHFVVNNGRTLCRSCHIKTPTWGNSIIYRKQYVAS